MNIGGHLRWQPLLRAAPTGARSSTSIPGFTQIWHAEGRDLGLEEHDLHFTVGLNVGTPRCPLPTDGIRWRPDPPAGGARPLARWPATPICAASRPWPAGAAPTARRPGPGRPTASRRTSSAASCRWRATVDARFELALDIHPADEADIERLDGTRLAAVRSRRGGGHRRLPPLRAGVGSRVLARAGHLRAHAQRLVQRPHRALPRLGPPGARPGHGLRRAPAHRRRAAHLPHARRGAGRRAQAARRPRPPPRGRAPDRRGALRAGARARAAARGRGGGAVSGDRLRIVLSGMLAGVPARAARRGRCSSTCSGCAGSGTTCSSSSRSPAAFYRARSVRVLPERWSSASGSAGSAALLDPRQRQHASACRRERAATPSAADADLLLNISGTLDDEDLLERDPGARVRRPRSGLHAALVRGRGHRPGLRPPQPLRDDRRADRLGRLPGADLRARVDHHAPADRARALARGRRARARRPHDGRPLARLRIDRARRRALRPEGPLAAPAARPSRSAAARASSWRSGSTPTSSATSPRCDAHGWELLEPARVAGTPDAYADFVRGSWAEFALAKSGYAASCCGWFSDRSVCYLASGRPVLALDTGFAPDVPDRRGPARLLDARRGRGRGRRAAQPTTRATAAPPARSPRSCSTPTACSPGCCRACEPTRELRDDARGPPRAAGADHRPGGRTPTARATRSRTSRPTFDGRRVAVAGVQGRRACRAPRRRRAAPSPRRCSIPSARSRPTVDVLGPAGSRCRDCYGAVAEPAAGGYWLFLEAVDGVPLWQASEPTAWEEAARWLADLHGGGPRRLARATCSTTTRRTCAAGSIARWPSRRRARCDAVAAVWDRVVERLAAWPRTFVHGEFYPSNVLVRRRPPGARASCPSTGRWRASAPDCSTWPRSPPAAGPRRSGSGWRSPTATRFPSRTRPAADDLLDALAHCRHLHRRAVARLVAGLDAPGRARPRLAGRGAVASRGARVVTCTPAPAARRQRRRLRAQRGDQRGRPARRTSTGIVTSTSLMVRQPAAAEAAAPRARATRGLGLGLHIDLGEWELRRGRVAADLRGRRHRRPRRGRARGRAPARALPRARGRATRPTSTPTSTCTATSRCARWPSALAARSSGSRCASTARIRLLRRLLRAGPARPIGAGGHRPGCAHQAPARPARR